MIRTKVIIFFLLKQFSSEGLDNEKPEKDVLLFLSHLNKYINLLLSLACTLTILFIIISQYKNTSKDIENCRKAFIIIICWKACTSCCKTNFTWKKSEGEKFSLSQKVINFNQFFFSILKNFHASKNYPPTTSSTLCDNSNDSGLGFDHHESHHSYVQSMSQQQVLAFTNNNYHRTMNAAIRCV